MTVQQRLFLIQGQSGFAVFTLLRNNSRVAPCHALHYLQMATEMLGKAYVWKFGPPAKLSHHAFVRFLRNLETNRLAQRQLGCDGQNERWQNLIAKSIPLAQGVESLAPNLAGDGPTPEYPWPPAMPDTAPVEHEFRLWSDLRDTAAGRQFLTFTGQLFVRAGAFL